MTVTNILPTTQLTEKVLKFWFKGFKAENSKTCNYAELLQFWFKGGEKVDLEVKKEFQTVVDEVLDKKQLLTQFQNDWKINPDNGLAALILLDQFPRHIYRNQTRSFIGHETAPLEHSENLEDQDLTVERMKKLAEDGENDVETVKFFCKNLVNYAIGHQLHIKKFGRFPHRNSILGRQNTEEEQRFLALFKKGDDPYTSYLTELH